ncbi:Sperm flagellar protein 1 [Blattella germanica]|nr:Sperm flagellar protein 1 [Blattella germanica]
MDEGDKEDLYEWIDKIPLSKRTGNICRDFSDGVLMAELLKFYYPRHVDLHNYSPANSKAHKMDNWATLNRKVLNKLGLQITSTVINNLVASSPGAIQDLLESVRRKIMGSETTSLSSTGDDYFMESPGGTAINPSRNLNGVKISTEKMVPVKILECKLKELSEKEENIAMLAQRVDHLENLVKLKDQRITELSTQLQRYQK